MSKVPKKYRKILDEPNMSDKTLLLNVEDLINLAFGTLGKNIVNFKMVQTILHILARQMRMLNQEVEIRLDDILGDYRPRMDLEELGSEVAEYSRGEEERGARGGEIATGGEEGKGGRGSESATGGEEGRGARGGESATGGEEGRGARGDKSAIGGEEGRGTKRGESATGGEEGRGARGSESATDDEGSGGASGENENEEDKAVKGGDKGGTEKRKSVSKVKDKVGTKGKEGTTGKDKTGKDRGKRKGKGVGTPGMGGADRSEDADEGPTPRTGESPTGKGGERGRERSARKKRTQDKADDAYQSSDQSGEKRDKKFEKKKDSDEPKSGKTKDDSRRQASSTSIEISETSRGGGRGGKDKILVVEKGPTTRTDSRTHVGSIEVVTASQFALLENTVKKLMTVAGPLPMPSLPDNEKLRKDLAKGTASLTDTMQAMQLTARVQAAEQALTRMAGMLTQLAAAGVVPKELSERMGQLEAELSQIGKLTSASASRTGAASRTGVERSAAAAAATTAAATSSRKSVMIDPLTNLPVRSDAGRGEAVADRKRSMPDTASTAFSRSSVAAGHRFSMVSGAGSGGLSLVTHPEMQDTLQFLKEDLIKDMKAMTAKSSYNAEVAASVAKSIAEKLDVALKLDKRIDALYSQTGDYAEQLSGFDSGVATQMASFQEQMATMKNELNNGLTQLAAANSNAESMALQELHERYDILVTELDNTMHAHSTLVTLQKQLTDELRSLVECVEMLREQKADRDEVLDGLKDKADMSRLKGLLSEEDFAITRAYLEDRIEMCYEKFRKQDRVWIGAIKDLTTIAEGKAEIMTLMSIKHSATEDLRNIQASLRQLFIMLGEPKAAILMRALAKNAHCGACMVPALMEPTDREYGQPPRLPRLRAAPDEPCTTSVDLPAPPDTRDHVCRRWVGGSHTLMGDNVLHERPAAQQLHAPPTKRYTGYGADGKLYMLEEELQPCLECNKLSTDEPLEDSQPLPSDGGGDQVSGPLPTPNGQSEKKGTGDQVA